MESTRVRLVFEDRRMLSKSQKSEGLNRSWLLLTPQHQTISDVSLHLLHTFNLQKSCPDGLILFMDDFVLPPFESTCILKDKDTLCVKKKRGTLSDITVVGDATNPGGVTDILEKKPIRAGLLLLANEEVGKEAGGCQSDPEEDEEYLEDHLEDSLLDENSSGGIAVSKKRKAHKKLQSSKKKKQRLVPVGSVENDIIVEHTETDHDDGVLPRKSSHKKVSDGAQKKNTESLLERNDTDVEAMTSTKRADQHQENNKVIQNVSQTSEGTNKASRSARRKKAKRQWMREMAKIGKNDSSKLQWKPEAAKVEKKNGVSHSKGLLHWKPSLEKEIRKNVAKHKKSNEKSDAEDDVVPIVIRPGHIRFEHPNEDQVVQKSQAPVETFKWNGIISKKKGQKWGQEKFSTSWRSDHQNSDKVFTQDLTVEKEIPPNDVNHLDKLPSLPSLPKEGDVIAYRLLELSSSWTPELSSFRVGKISCYDPGSSRIKLMPVPEYPVALEKLNEEASQSQTKNALYGEDGYLEIDFPSLVDVRLLKQSDIDPAKVVTAESPAANENHVSNTVPSDNGDEAWACTPAKGSVSPWDQFTEALNAKKAQLSQGKGWGKESSGKSTWPYKALKGSALGPTMALLRSKNQIGR